MVFKANYNPKNFYLQDTFLYWFDSNLLKPETKDKLANCYAESGLCTSIANPYFDAVESVPYVETDNTNFKVFYDEVIETLDNTYGVSGHLSVLDEALLGLVVSGVAETTVTSENLRVVYSEGGDRLEVRNIPVITEAIMRLDLLCSSVGTVSNLLTTKRSSKEIYVINSEISETLKDLGGSGTDLIGDIDRRVSLMGVGISDTKISKNKAPEDYKEPKVVQLPESNITDLMEVERMATVTAYNRSGLSWKTAASANLSLESLLSLREDYINRVKGIAKKWEKFLLKIAKLQAMVMGMSGVPEDLSIVVPINRGVIFPSQIAAMISAKESGLIPHEDLLIEYGYIDPSIPLDKLRGFTVE